MLKSGSSIRFTALKSTSSRSSASEYSRPSRSRDSADSRDSPVLFVLPLDPAVKGINRIRLRDMTNVKWLGCLNPSGSDSGGGKSWWDKLIPKF